MFIYEIILHYPFIFLYLSVWYLSGVLVNYSIYKDEADFKNGDPISLIFCMPFITFLWVSFILLSWISTIPYMIGKIIEFLYVYINEK